MTDLVPFPSLENNSLRDEIRVHDPIKWIRSRPPEIYFTPSYIYDTISRSI